MEVQVFKSDPFFGVHWENVFSPYDLLSLSSPVIQSNLQKWIPSQKRQAKHPDSGFLITNEAVLIDISRVFVIAVDLDFVLLVNRRCFPSTRGSEEDVFDRVNKSIDIIAVQGAKFSQDCALRCMF